MRYLSSRIIWMSLSTFVLAFLFLVLLTIMLVRDQKPLLFVCSGYVALILLGYAAYKWIYVPYKRNSKLLNLFVTGYTIQDLFNQRYSLSPEIEGVANKVREIMETGELLHASKKQAQYLALQNQINPHFLYNTLEGIRSETLLAGLDNVANMTEALATFFRYTISNVENLVTVEDELMNVKNYYIIQKYRFGDRLNVQIEYDQADESEILACHIPKLTLQPILENSIRYGVERKSGVGNVRITIEISTQRLIITISDNGIGMTEETLKEINDNLSGTSLDHIHSDSKAHGGIALVNVSNRIKLLFGEEYGIYVYSRLNIGTDVEITLPYIADQKRN